MAEKVIMIPYQIFERFIFERFLKTSSEKQGGNKLESGSVPTIIGSHEKRGGGYAGMDIPEFFNQERKNLFPDLHFEKEILLKGLLLRFL